MKYRDFGRKGFQVGELGFGAWAIGESSWGRQDEAESLKALHRAAELGCTVSPDRAVGELRTGDQQLVEIARAISLESKILIMDEPTSALTEAEATRLYAIIGELCHRGVTVLYISHKLDEIFRLCNRISVLRDGRLVASLERDATDAAEIARLMVGREIAAASFQSERAAGEGRRSATRSRSRRGRKAARAASGSSSVANSRSSADRPAA